MWSIQLFPWGSSDRALRTAHYLKYKKALLSILDWSTTELPLALGMNKHSASTSSTAFMILQMSVINHSFLVSRTFLRSCFITLIILLVLSALSLTSLKWTRLNISRNAFCMGYEVEFPNSRHSGTLWNALQPFCHTDHLTKEQFVCSHHVVLITSYCTSLHGPAWTLHRKSFKLCENLW